MLFICKATIDSGTNWRFIRFIDRNNSNWMLRYLLVLILSFSTVVEIFDISMDLNKSGQVEVCDVDDSEKNPEPEKKKDFQDKDKFLDCITIISETDNKIGYEFNHNTEMLKKIYISEPTPPPEL